MGKSKLWAYIGAPTFALSKAMQLLTHKHKDFPPSIYEIEDPVKKIYYEGELELLKKNYLAVVGARSVLPWVEYWLEQELIPSLRDFDIGIVSGGARGVDQLAHHCALRAGLPTLAVLPSGLSNKYPKNIQSLLGESESIGYISEYEPDECMRKHFFYRRNRIIAAFSPLTLVIQAAVKSGSMITARFAIQYGRSIATLPASPMDPSFGGNLQLIYDGSYFVRNSDDLKALLFKYFNSSYCAGKRRRPVVGQ